MWLVQVHRYRYVQIDTYSYEVHTYRYVPIKGYSYVQVIPVPEEYQKESQVQQLVYLVLASKGTTSIPGNR